jgi:hypothetical protein
MAIGSSGLDPRDLVRSEPRTLKSYTSEASVPKAGKQRTSANQGDCQSLKSRVSFRS